MFGDFESPETEVVNYCCIAVYTAEKDALKPYASISCQVGEDGLATTHFRRNHMSSNTRLAWGIMGTGRIAKTFAKAVTTSKMGRLVAVGSRSQETADAFAAEFAIPKGYPTYEAMLADPEVKAVYISMPHHLHKEWTIKACNAGKHVLCEKPIGINAAEAQAMIDAAKKNKVFLMEAFMYRCHPQTQKLVELIKSNGKWTEPMVLA